MKIDNKILIIIVVVSLGVGFEVTKSLLGSSAPKEAQIQTRELDLEPYSRPTRSQETQPSSGRFQKRQNLLAQQRQLVDQARAARAQPVGSALSTDEIRKLEEAATYDHSFNHNDEEFDKTKAAKAVAANKDEEDEEDSEDEDSEYEEILDEDGNVVEVRKREKNKDEEDEDEDSEEVAKNANEEESSQPEDNDPASDQEDKVQEANHYGVAIAVGAGARNAGNMEDDDNLDAHNDLEEWKRILLNQPDYAATTRFIRLYQSQVVSHEVFYEIVRLMLEDSRPQLKEYGLMALGGTTSYKSFTTLAHFIHREPFSSSYRQQAEALLNNYSQLAHLKILARILSESDSISAVILAAKQLDQAAQIHLAGNVDGQSDGSSSGSSQNANEFAYFVDILENLLETNLHDPLAQDEISNTLANLRNLLS